MKSFHKAFSFKISSEEKEDDDGDDVLCIIFQRTGRYIGNPLPLYLGDIRFSSQVVYRLSSFLPSNAMASSFQTLL